MWGSSAHSLIKSQVKRHLNVVQQTLELFLTATSGAKNTDTPFKVTKLCFDDFFDIRALATEMGPLNISQIS